MPKISPGNRLYLYQLLSRSIGVGRQTLLPRVEEALAEDGLDPADLGCADMRALCEQLPEFIKLTVFKKGYVYATVLANEEYDKALDRAGTGATDKAAASGKPWKRKRGAKALKPVKPRHIQKDLDVEKDLEAEKNEPEAAAVPEPVVEPEPETAAAPEPEPEIEVAAAPEPEPETEAMPEDSAEPEPEVEATAEPEATAVPEPEAAAVPEPEPDPTPITAPTPSISLTITYVPEPKPSPEPDAAPSPIAPAPEPEQPAIRRVQSDLPQDFHADVRCSSDQLSVLYQVLPDNVDPMATLEEDFRTARATGELEGTRSNVSFALRYLQPDGKTPVRVTLRRSARAVAGKRWALTQIDAGTLEEVGLDGLSVAQRGPWLAFVDPTNPSDPGQTLSQTVAIGTWGEALEQLALLAAPEDWGTERAVLRDYLTMTLVRVMADERLAVDASGERARFDTGLVTGEGMPVLAELARITGDIPWQLVGFTTEGSAEPARYVTELAQMTFDPNLAAPDFPSHALVERNPRLATPAYDPVGNATRLLVPNGDSALALAVTPTGYERLAELRLADAYACARVISADQPAWLTAGRA